MQSEVIRVSEVPAHRLPHLCPEQEALRMDVEAYRKLLKKHKNPRFKKPNIRLPLVSSTFILILLSYESV